MYLYAVRRHHVINYKDKIELFLVSEIGQNKSLRSKCHALASVHVNGWIDWFQRLFREARGKQSA